MYLSFCAMVLKELQVFGYKCSLAKNHRQSLIINHQSYRYSKMPQTRTYFSTNQRDQVLMNMVPFLHSGRGSYSKGNMIVMSTKLYITSVTIRDRLLHVDGSSNTLQAKATVLHRRLHVFFNRKLGSGHRTESFLISRNFTILVLKVSSPPPIS